MKTFIVDVSLEVSVNPSTAGTNSIFCADEFKGNMVLLKLTAP